MIIIEGPDGTGKSTLAARLRDLTLFHIEHYAEPPMTYDDFLRRKYKACWLMTQKVIQDRCPIISEYVYGSAFGRSLISRKEVDLIFERLDTPIFIYCNKEYEHVPDPKETAEYLEKLELNKNRIWDKYNNYFEDMRSNHRNCAQFRVYDTLDYGEEQILKKVREGIPWYYLETSQ